MFTTAFSLLSCFAFAAISSVGAVSVPSNLRRRSGNETTYAFSLPYATSALAPWVSNQTNVIHLEILAGATAGLHAESAAIVKLLAQPVLDFTAINAAAGTIQFVTGAIETHIIYFNSLAPTSMGGGNFSLASKNFTTQVTKDFGSYANMIESLNDETAMVPASGWGWLVYDTKAKALDTTYTENEDLLDPTLIPLLTVDIWEHAYFVSVVELEASLSALI
ncbi:superoxide dismutase, Fe-Mn family, partial [Phenoliferia sp. Uapishka_3]